MTETSAELDDLRSLYRTAFNEWASEPRREGDRPNPSDAESRYRGVRERLIAAMSAASEELELPAIEDGAEPSFASRRQRAVDELQRLSGKGSL